MKRIKRSFLLVMMLMFALILSACLNTSSGGSTNGESSGTEEAKTESPKLNEGEETVTIGYSGPLSGAAAQYGLNVLNGLKMAADEINETGFEVNGKTYKIEIASLDDKYQPNETGVNVKRMVSENDPVAVWIPHSGGVFATQIFNEQDNFIIMAQSSEPRMYDQGNKLMVGISMKYDIWPETFSNYMMEKFGKKIALLPTNSQYGMDWLNVIKPVWEEKGGEIVYENPIDFAKETDYFTILTNALNTKPDVLFVGGPSEPTALVIKQAKELGFNGGFMLMDQSKMDEMSEILGGYDKLNGSIGVPPTDKIGTPGSEIFVKNYTEKFDEKIASIDSQLSYQVLHVLVGAMKAAGSVEDRQAIMASINEGIQNLPEEKMVGKLSGINDDGSLKWDFDAAIIEDGKVILKPLE